MSESRKYNFGGYHPEANVECSQLDAFLDALEAVCEKHGLGFQKDYDDRRTIILVPYAEGEDLQDFLASDLELATDIPWLAAAMDFYKANVRRIREREDARREAEQVAAGRAHRERLLRDGIELEGKRYRLVEKLP